MSELFPAKQHSIATPIAAPVVTYADGRITIDNVPCTEPFQCFDDLNECELMNVVHGYKHLLSHGTRAGKRASEAMKQAGIPLDNDLFRLPFTYTPLYRAPSAQLTIDFCSSSAHKAVIRIQDTDQPDALPIPKDGDAMLTVPLSEHPIGQSRGLANHIESLQDDLWITFLMQGQDRATDTQSQVPHGFREMTPQEITDYFNKYCTECAQELQQYLTDIYDAALRDGTQPDYFFRID